MGKRDLEANTFAKKKKSTKTDQTLSALVRPQVTPVFPARYLAG